MHPSRFSAVTFRAVTFRAVTVFAVAALGGLAACGADDEVADAAAAATTTSEVATTLEQPASTVDEDHDGDDHEDGDDHADDGDHGDEDHDDHDEDDHGDDHDEDDHDHSSGLGAHEHGAAEMTVAWIDSDVSIELVSPTFNVFGFEYEPETAEDVAFAAEQTELLIADGTIAVNDEAACTLTEPASTSVEQEGTHSEITASWLLSCENPDEISVIDAGALFAAFPNFEDIDVEWLSASTQSSAELTPEAPSFTLES